MNEIDITAENIAEICNKVTAFLEKNTHIVATHDYNCGFNGNYDKYMHRTGSNCVCRLDDDGICRIYMKEFKDDRVVHHNTGIIIMEGATVVITDTYICIKNGYMNHEVIYWLIYPDYAYNLNNKCQDCMHDDIPIVHADCAFHWGYRTRFDLPDGTNDIIEAYQKWDAIDISTREIDKVLAGMGYYRTINDNLKAAIYMTFLNMTNSKFGLISRFAKYACKYIENGGDLDDIECKWCDMIFDWLERVNPRLVDIDKGFFTITKGKRRIVASEQDVYNFLGVHTEDSFFSNYMVGKRYSICYTHHDLTTHEIRTYKETYQSPGEHRIFAVNYGPIDKRGGMNIGGV